MENMILNAILPKWYFLLGFSGPYKKIYSRHVVFYPPDSRSKKKLRKTYLWIECRSAIKTIWATSESQKSAVLYKNACKKIT